MHSLQQYCREKKLGGAQGPPDHRPPALQGLQGQLLRHCSQPMLQQKHYVFALSAQASVPWRWYFFRFAMTKFAGDNPIDRVFVTLDFITFINIRKYDASFNIRKYSLCEFRIRSTATLLCVNICQYFTSSIFVICTYSIYGDNQSYSSLPTD